MVISDLCENIKAGGLTSKIQISHSEKAPVFYIYNMDHLNSDLIQSDDEDDLSRTSTISTVSEASRVETTCEGDLLYCLMNQTAAIVQKKHSGFILTPNFVRMTPKANVSKSYLLFLLNCSESIMKQINMGSGVSVAKRASLRSVLEAEIDPLPDLKTQEIVGNTYLQQMHLYYLRKKSNEDKNTFVVEALKKVAGID